MEKMAYFSYNGVDRIVLVDTIKFVPNGVYITGREDGGNGQMKTFKFAHEDYTTQVKMKKVRI